MAGLRMLGRGVKQAEVARALGVSRQAVSSWARALADVGGQVDRLDSRPLGRPKRLSVSQCELLSRLLAAGAKQAGFNSDRWTVKRVCAVMAREFGTDYSPSGCWELLRGLGLRLKQIDPQARLRDAQSVSRGKQKD